MRKLLFLFAVLFMISCTTYTVKTADGTKIQVNSDNDVYEIGDTVTISQLNNYNWELSEKIRKKDTLIIGEYQGSNNSTAKSYFLVEYRTGVIIKKD